MAPGSLAPLFLSLRFVSPSIRKGSLPMLSSTETLLVVAIVYGLLFAAGRLANGDDDRDETTEATDP
jgi:hypothetical protein